MDARVRLRPWLENRLNEGWIEGLCWVDREKGIFRIPWKHHSKHTWTEQDAAIFKDWAVVTGRYREGIDDPDWPMWKTRLRCALNKAPDIQEVKQRHNLHCDEPFKVYRFISKTESLWRANATRNASMIFDGLPAMDQLPNAFNFQSLSSRRVFNPPNGIANQRRPTILLSRIPSVARVSGAPYPCHGSRPLAIIRRQDKLFVQKLSLRSLLPSSSLQRQVPPATPQQVQLLSTTTLDSLDVGATQEVLSSPSSQLSSLRHCSNSFPSLHPPSFLPFLPDLMEPEYHQIAIRIQHLNVRIKDVIVTNPNGCCVYFGRYDENIFPVSNPTEQEDVFITSSPDPIEMAITHVSQENRSFVEMLLSNMMSGVLITANSVDGSIYVKRLCRCALFVYFFDESIDDYALVKKVVRGQPVKIFDFSKFVAQLEYYRLGDSPKPHFEVILAFGQQLEAGDSPQSLLVWARVASCRAWFHYQKVVSDMKATNYHGPSFPTSGSLNAQSSKLIGDEVSALRNGIEGDVCILPGVDGSEVSLYSSGLKFEPEEVEEEVVISTSLCDDDSSTALIDPDTAAPAVDEVMKEEETVLDIPREDDDNLLDHLAVE